MNDSTSSARNKIDASSPILLVDREHVIEAFELIVPPGSVCEVRVLDATTPSDRWEKTYFGYFNDAKKLTVALEKIASAKGIYITLNPVDPQLMSRAYNRLKVAKKGEATSDNDIERRIWFPIDCDYHRPAGISSSDEEHLAALQMTNEICEYLTSLGWPAGVKADSGNGGHNIYAVDLPVDDGGLIQRCLRALALRFNRGDLIIDETVFNPSRIWKLYGTKACKGDSTPDRPHRMSRIISRPEQLQVVPRELLEKLAAEAPDEVDARANPPAAGNGRSAFDLDRFITENDFQVDGPDSWNGGRKWQFRVSPMCEHHDGAAFIAELANGAISAKCHHNSCSWTWHDLRGKYESKRSEGNGRRNDNKAKTGKPPPAPPIQWQPFPLHTLPDRLRRFVLETSQSMVCDPSFVVLPALSVLAACVGNSRRIHIKRGWWEPCIIWSVVIAPPSSMKTPAWKAACRPLQRGQHRLITQHNKDMDEHEQTLKVYELQLTEWKKQGRQQADQPPEKPKPPVCQRTVTSDATIEAVISIFGENPRGLLYAVDELAGWLNSMNCYKGGKGGDREAFLSMHGAGPVISDRKTGRRITSVPCASLSICGTIQPGVYIKHATSPEFRDSGLISRLLVARPPIRCKRWTDNEVSEDAENDYVAMLNDLLEIALEITEDDEPEPMVLWMDQTAKSLWVNWYEEFNADAVDANETLAGHFGKIEAYAARFALLFQLIEDPNSTRVEGLNMARGIELARWFAHEAQRVNATTVETADEREQRELLELIERRGREIAPRDLARGPRRYRDTEEAEQALQKLCDAGHGAWDVSPTGGRPKTLFRLNSECRGDKSPDFQLENELLSPSPLDDDPEIDPVEQGESDDLGGTIDGVPF